MAAGTYPGGGLTAAPSTSTLTEDETVYIVEHFLRSHPWVRPRMEAAPTDAEAMVIAKRELGNSGFGEPKGVMPSGRPGCSRQVQREFWRLIASGQQSDAASRAIGRSRNVGIRWFS